MNPVPINLQQSPGAKLIVNHLVETPSLADLDQDLVLVELPGEVFIDVSWHPENETPGAYYVTVFKRNDWDRPLEMAEAKTPQRAAWLVEMTAERYLVRLGPISCSNESVIDAATGQ